MIFNIIQKMHNLSNVNGLLKSFYRNTLTISSTRSMSTKTLAVCQMTSTNDKEVNFNTVKKLVENAKRANAAVVFFPEACDFIGNNKEEIFQLAEPLNGPLVTKYKELAKKEKVWLSLGGIHEVVDLKKMRNTHLVINDEGSIVGYYSKIHLFDLEIPEQNIRIHESSYIQRGNDIPQPVDTPIGKMGLSICYDMRFPELSLTLTKMGAQILTYPSAFTFNTGSSHWEVLLRAKAIESQCYVVAAAQTGVHNKKRTSWGHAVVIDPWGSIIAQCSEGEGFVTATIDLDYLKKVRRNLPVWNHRRNDLYPVLSPMKSSPSSPEAKEFYEFGQVKISRDSIFYRTSLTIAFTNKRCVVPGHVLIAPIRSVKRFADLSSDELSDLFQVTQKMSKIIEQMHNATSSTIVVQDGPEAGQTIQHVHVHILPRKSGDFARNDDIYDQLQKHDKDDSRPWRTEEEMCSEAELIRQRISDAKLL